MMEFAFEKGAGPQSVLSFGKKAWETAHLWVGVAVILAFIVHFCLNHRQFKNAVKTRAAYVALLLAGFGGAVLLALWPTSRAEGSGGNGQQAQIRARIAAKVLGYDLMENFRQPYFAVSVRDFWRRWHISLSTWFRDYVYIPLGGSRVGAFRRALNVRRDIRADCAKFL